MPPTSACLRLLPLLILIPGVALAALPWEGEPFSAPAKEMALAAASTGKPADASQQSYALSRKVDFAADGSSTQRVHEVYRVLTPGAARGAAVEATFAPWMQDRPEVKARVISPEGVESWLDPRTLAETGAESGEDNVYTDSKVLKGPLPNVQAGSVVEVTTTFHNKPSLITRLGWGSELYPQEREKLGLWRLSITAPDSLPLAAWSRGNRVPLTVEVSGGQRRVSAELRNVEPLPRYEPNLPIDENLYLQVYFGSARDWGSLARGYAEVVDQALRDPALPELAARVIGKEKDPKKAAQKAMDWVSENVRYTGLHFGDAAIVPYKPSQVLDRGYGDCKDLAVLVTGLLRNAGLAASVALVSSQGSEWPESVPSLSAFDHAIVHVEGKSPFFLDATASHHAAGSLPTRLQGRRALVASSSPGKGRVLIPEARSQDNRALRVREVYLEDTTSASVVETEDQFGELGAWVWYGADQGTTESRQKRVESYAKEVLRCDTFKAWEPPRRTDSGAVRDVTSGTGCLESGVGLNENRWYLRRGSLFSAIPSLLEKAPEKDAEKRRKHALFFPMPYQSELRYRVHPPPGYQIGALPRAEQTKWGPASLETRVQTEKDGSVRVTYLFDSGPRVWSPEQVEAFQTAYADWGSSNADVLLFQHRGSALIEEGKVKEGLAVLQAQLSENPKSAVYNLRLAGELGDLGFIDEARALAKKAAALEPGRRLSWSILYELLVRNELGVVFGRGFDRKGAKEALEKILALSPDDRDIRLKYAQLLERDAEGAVRGAGAELDLAVAQYEKLLASKEEGDQDESNQKALAEALFAAGRYPRAVEVASSLKSDEMRGLRTAALALDKGVPAALSDLAHLPNDQKVLPVAHAVDRLQSKHAYPELRLAFAELLKLAPGNPKLKAASAMYEKVKSQEVKLGPTRDPKLLAAQLFAVAFESRAREAQNLLSSAADQEEPDAERSFDGLEPALRQAIGTQGLDRKGLVDVVLSLLELGVEGDAKGGYRVTLSGAGAPFMSLLLIEEKGAVKLRGVDSVQAASEALTRVQARDLDAAKRWLSWARELSQQNDQLKDLRARAWPAQGAASAESLAAQAAWFMAAGKNTLIAERALPVIDARLAQNPPEAELPALRVSRLFALLSSRKWAKALDALELTESVLPSRMTLAMKVGCLTSLKRWGEAEARVQQRLQDFPGDVELVELLSSIYEGIGDVGKARAQYETLVGSGKAGERDYNNLAWLGLFDAGLPLKKAIEYSERSTQNSRSFASLHTRACLEAEAGNGPAATNLLKEAAQAAHEERYSDQSWYVMARVAEVYGLHDVARAGYERVMKGIEEGAPTSTRNLAKRGLERLRVPAPALAAPAGP